MTQPGRVLTPRDLQSAQGAALAVKGIRVRVAGRVVYSDTTQTRIADAWAAIDVQFAAPEVFAPGLWLELEGTPFSSGASFLGGLAQGVVLQRAHGVFAAQGEFASLQSKSHALQSRSRALHAVRDYFAGEGFLEVETPTRVSAPGTDVYLDPIASAGQWLITSPEFHLKRLLAGGVPRLFEVARCFRADEVGVFHQPQFTLLEWYRSWQPYQAVMRDTEALVQHIARAVNVPLTRSVKGQALNFTPPFETLRVADAFERYAHVADVAALANDDEALYFAHWVNEVEPALGALGRPVFLTEFPLSQAALAQPCAHDPRYAERFELFAGPVELCNGYGELTSHSEQRARFEHDVARRLELGKPALPIDEAFIDALAEGLPPCSGNALGFERLLALLLERSLADVIAFPLLPR